MYLLVLYVVLMFIRVIVIAVAFPFLSRIGHKCTFKEACFMAWAGLRGALGMALALLVEKNCRKDIGVETSRMFFFVGGAFLMIIIAIIISIKIFIIIIIIITTIIIIINIINISIIIFTIISSIIIIITIIIII